MALDWALAHREVVALAAIMALAAALRLTDLGSRALHHDESLHAFYSWRFYQGEGYQHHPLMHGPFQFHMGALMFFLFGDTEASTRVGHAILGTAMVGMPYLLRKQIGMRAVLIAALLISFSPTLLYFSRFDREDIFVAFWTLAMVIAFWRYLDERKPVFLYALAATLALAFATKETTFITVAVFLAFANVMLAVELVGRRPGEEASRLRVGLRRLALVPFAWLLALFWPLFGSRPFGRERLPAAGDLIVVLATLSLPQFSAGVQVLAGLRDQFYSLDGIPLIGAVFHEAGDLLYKLRDQGFREPSLRGADPESDLRLLTVAVFVIASLYLGLLWRPREWLVTAAFFYVPFILLFTTFFTNTPAPWSREFLNGGGGFWSGTWGSLDYWLEQHNVKRGNQPIYYYTLLVPLYEFLPLLLSLGGAAWLAFRGTFLTRSALFWFGGIFLGLTIAGEKMPWLGVHLALPLAIIAALSLDRLLEALDFRAKGLGRSLATGVAAAAAVLLLVELEQGSLGWFLGLILAGGALGSIAFGLAAEGPRAGGRTALILAVAVLFALTVRAGYVASFKHGDVPVELLVYTQTSPDLPRVNRQIAAAAQRSGLGLNLPIVVDATEGFSWPWAWYLRDYKSVSHVSAFRDYRPPAGTVLLINHANVPLIPVEGFTTVPYKHRWWFPETYRGLTLGEVLDVVSSPRAVRDLGEFLLYRRATPRDSSVNAVAFFPETFGVGQPAVSPAAPLPVTLADGRIVIGGRGNAGGELDTPADVFVDAQGNIWVADTRNGRVQKYDAAGVFVTAINRAGTDRLNEPWSVAVAADGSVFIADTWNHRIVKLSPEGQFSAAWGRPAADPSRPGPFDLYGPRDIAIAADGTLWVSDTGNKRLLQYSPSGEFIASHGREGVAPGQFNEVVGLAFDAQGNLYAADTWNGRVQRFSPGFQPSGEFSTGWVSTAVLDKPYIAVLADGRLLTTEPARGQLLLYSPEGTLLGAWKPDADSRPIGVAALPDGGFVFSDGARHQLQVVPAAMIPRLFR
jgi:predicted membrane-bound mannosyltransferase/sugar lactone lactonase YvrE